MKTYAEDEVRAMLNERIEKAGTKRAFALQHDINVGYLGRVVAGAPLSPAILTALGLEIAETVTTYRKIRSQK